ncbi:MAG: transporter substrate-binding protein [Rariglobus sp.]|jgi:oligopeptide transport system substrate-binding protein|nr:transporter substrate-binding protein [Rariglobus sp.]
MIRPLFGLLALVTAFGLVTTGCSKKSGASSNNGEKILRVGNGAEPQDLDPQATAGVPEHKIQSTLFEGLVTDAADGQGIAPGVAESWEISPDGRTYTFRLRSDAKWSNGEPVTARDFVGSFERILNPSFAAEYASMLYPLKGAQDYNTGKLTDFSQVGVHALDDRNLQLSLTDPAPFLLEAIKHNAWFPVHLPTLAKFGGIHRKGTPWTRPGHLVGNGPFVLTEWRPNQRIVVRRSPTYWDRDNVKLDQIELHAIENQETEERMFRTGKLDYAYGLPLSKIEVYRREHPDVYRQEILLSTYFYRFNVTRPPFNDVRVRRALALAIDREAIVKNVTRAGQQPAYNITPPSARFAARTTLDAGLPDQPARIAEARRLLAEAGYPDGKNFPTAELLYNTSDGHRAIAEAIQQMWRVNLGINITIKNEEWKVFQDTCLTGNYQIARAGWGADYDDPHTFLSIWRTGDGNNQTGFSNTDYDRILGGALSTPNETARMEAYQQLEAILARETPIMPIYFYTRVYAISPRVKNWVPNPLDLRGWKWIDLAP